MIGVKAENEAWHLTTACCSLFCEEEISGSAVHFPVMDLVNCGQESAARGSTGSGEHGFISPDHFSYL